MDCSQCPPNWPLRCDCNKPGNFTCNGRGSTCYSDYGKILFKILIESDCLQIKINRINYCLQTNGKAAN